MIRDRWPEIKPLLERALEAPAERRREIVRAGCGGDDDLRRLVEEYLALDEDTEAGDFFEEPLLDLIAGRPPEHRAGQLIGPYRLESEIARGGMGVVYRALRVEGGFEQEVAVKVLKRGFDTGSFVRRFRTEQQILASLDHPNIVRLLDGGATEDGLPYLVMESVEGIPLGLYCQQVQPDLEQRLELFSKICDAVHTAHQHMVVHCDLKPSNILVTADGEPKLLDFGIAKVLQQGTDGVDPSLSLRLGTFLYASPEQIAGAAITTANDIYSLGCLFFLLLTGRAPRRQATAEAALQVPSQALEGPAADGEDAEIPRPLIHRDQLRGDLDAITLKAMAWDPAQRYSSAAALADDIRRHRHQLPVTAQPYSWTYVTGRLLRRRRKEVLVAASFLLLAVVAGVGSLWLKFEARLQSSRATEMRAAYLEILEVYDPTSAESKSEAVKTAVDKLVAYDRFGEGEDRAIIYDRMGRLFYRLQSLPESEKLLERALALRQQAVGPDPKALAASLNNLALVVKARGDLKRASQLYEQATAIHGQNPGLSQHDLLDLQANLAVFYEDQGDFERAEALFRQTLEGRRQLWGDDSLEVAKSLNNYGKLLVRLGRLDEAEPLLREALASREKRFGPDHASVAVALMNLAALEDARGDQQEGIALYRRALAIRLKIFGSDNAHSAYAQAALGYALSGRGGPADLAEAEDLLDSAWATSLDKNGPGHEATLIIQRNLAAVRLLQGNAVGAEALIRPVVDGSGIWQNRFSWRAAEARSLLGACLLAQGQIDAARPLLEGTAELIAKEKGKDSRPAREARERWEAWKQKASSTNDGGV